MKLNAEQQALMRAIECYWNLAYAEGKEGRTHDTEAGDAQACLFEIQNRIKALGSQSDDAKNAARYRWLRDSKDCSLSINHDDHHCSYETVSVALKLVDGVPTDQYYHGIPAEECAKMVATDSIWTLHIYPNTPVGFNVYHAATLDTAVDAAMQDYNQA